MTATLRRRIDQYNFLPHEEAAITRAMTYAADQLGGNVWCEGDSITLADLALVSVLIYLDLRQAERDWRGAHPNLAAWFTRINQRASLRTALAG